MCLSGRKCDEQYNRRFELEILHTYKFYILFDLLSFNNYITIWKVKNNYKEKTVKGVLLSFNNHSL